jgi:hypothetical protein
MIIDDDSSDDDESSEPRSSLGRKWVWLRLCGL